MKPETITKMEDVIAEMLEARYNPPSVAAGNAADIMTRLKYEGLL